MPLSGWPLTGADLEPFYQMAEARLGLISEHMAMHVLDRMGSAAPNPDSRIVLDRSRPDADDPGAGVPHGGPSARQAQIAGTLRAPASALTLATSSSAR